MSTTIKYGDSTIATIGSKGGTKTLECNGKMMSANVSVNSSATAWGDITGTLSNQTDLNGVLTTIKGDIASDYSATATYAVGDYCLKDGAFYRCTTAITTAEEWTAGHWTRKIHL